MVEPLAAENIAHLRSLNLLFGRAFGDAPTYCLGPPSDDYLRRLLAREHIIVLAALLAGDVVGGLVAYELDKFERARREVYIYDLAVAESHRRKGIATALIRSVCAIAVRRAASVVYVQANHGDRAAIALYEKLGVREEVLHFEIGIRPKS